MKSVTGLLFEIEARRFVSDEREAHRRARVGLVVREEVEKEHVDVLDPVVAGAHRFVREHVHGDVSRHHHAARVRFLREERHELGLHRVVDLDALVAALLEELDGRLGLRLVLRGHFARRGLRVSPFDEAESNDVRSDGGAFVPTFLVVVELVGIVSDVARGRHAGRDVERAVRVAEVRVHVPKARQERLAREIDHLCARRDLRGSGRSHRFDRVTDDDHGLIFEPRAVLHVEHASVREREARGRRFVRGFVRECFVARAIELILLLDDRVDVSLEALRHDGPPRREESEPRSVFVHPHVRRREIEAGDRVADDVLLRSGGGRHFGRDRFFDARDAAREKRERSARFDRGAREETERVGEIANRNEERGARVGLAGLFVALPARVTLVAREAFVDGRAHRVVTRRGERRDRSVAHELDRGVGVRPATVLEHVERDLDRAVGHDRRHVLARFSRQRNDRACLHDLVRDGRRHGRARRRRSGRSLCRLILGFTTARATTHDGNRGQHEHRSSHGRG